LKNILFITHYSKLYGANKSLLNLLDGLPSQEIKPFVLMPNTQGLEKELEKRKIKYFISPVPSWYTKKNRTLRLLARNLRNLYSAYVLSSTFIKENDIHLIYSNSSISPIGRLLAFINRIPHIWHIREFGDLDYDFHLLYPKSIFTFLILSSKAVVCVSASISKYFFNKMKKNIFTIYNGVINRQELEENIKKVQLKQINNKTFVFCIVGLLIPSKGQDIAIKAISELAKLGEDVELLIAGDGDQEFCRYCKNLVEELNLGEKIKFLGYIQNPFEVYLISDCSLVCSENEAMGRVTVEAMCSALPVIGKNSQGTSELIVHSKTGFLYNSFTDLVDYMKFLVKNPDLTRLMGKNGWKIAEEKYTQEAYASSILEVINYCL